MRIITYNNMYSNKMTPLLSYFHCVLFRGSFWQKWNIFISMLLLQPTRINLQDQILFFSCSFPHFFRRMRCTNRHHVFPALCYVFIAIKSQQTLRWSSSYPNSCKRQLAVFPWMMRQDGVRVSVCIFLRNPESYMNDPTDFPEGGVRWGPAITNFTTGCH